MDANSLRDLLLGDRELEARVAGVRNLTARARWAHHEDAYASELASEGEPLRDRRDTERCSAGRQRRARDVDCSVAVAVGLDDGPQLCALERAHECADVAPQRAEVDRDLRAMHGVQRLLTSRSTVAATCQVNDDGVFPARKGVGRK